MFDQNGFYFGNAASREQVDRRMAAESVMGCVQPSFDFEVFGVNVAQNCENEVIRLTQPDIQVLPPKGSPSACPSAFSYSKRDPNIYRS